MLRYFYAPLLAALCIAPALAAPDAHVQAKAEEWIHSSITGQWNRGDLAPHANARLTPGLERGLVSFFKSWGEPSAVTYETSETLPDRTIYDFLVTFPKNRIEEFFALDHHGRLMTLLLPPATPHLTQAQLLTALAIELQKQTAADDFSGAVLIAKDGKPIFQRAYNLADRVHNVPNTLKTRFRIGSMNKMFTAVAVLQLAQAGKLRLQDPFGKYLTDYPNKQLASKVTIAQLLTHTGGTGDFFGPEYDKNRLRLRTLHDYETLFGKRGSVTPLGHFAYSNYGFILLGLVIERVSGRSYYDFVRQRVYAPARMTSTGSEPENTHVAQRSVGYTKTGKAPWKPNTGTLPYRGTSAGGGYSTVGDLLAFANALRSGKLLDSKYTAMLIAPKVPMGQNAGYAYGFGVILTNGNRCYGHNGGAPGMNGNLAICAESGYTVIALSNFDPPAATDITDFAIVRLPLDRSR